MLSNFRFDNLTQKASWTPLTLASLYHLLGALNQLLDAEREVLLKELVKEYGDKPIVMEKLLLYFANAEIVSKVFRYSYVLRVAKSIYGRVIAESLTLPPLPKTYND